MGPGRGRKFALATLAACFAVLAMAVYGLKGFLAEEVHLYRLSSREPETRKAAARRLAAMGTPRVIPRMLAPYLKAMEKDVQAFATAKKIQLPAMTAPPDTESWTIETAMWNILYRGGPRSFDVLEALLADRASERRAFAVHALGIIATDSERRIRALNLALEDGDPEVRSAAATAVERLQR